MVLNRERIMFLWLSCLSLLDSCGSTKFNGDTPGPQPTSPPPITPTPAPTPPPSQCQDGHSVVGAQVVFLIDNSGSNAETDCPSPDSNASGNTQCGSATNRETAVLAAFDLLAAQTAKDSSTLAESKIGVIQFPSDPGTSLKSKNTTPGLVSTKSSNQNRNVLTSALAFTRQPGGGTPYGVAMDGAIQAFSTIVKDERTRVAILITDGEPTDRDPSSVNAKADQLKASGVKVFTIFVTGKMERSQLLSDHLSLLRDLDDNEMLLTKNHYYNADRYKTFDAFADEIIGGHGKLPLAEAITSKKMESCVDSGTQSCERSIFEVSDSSALKTAIAQIVSDHVQKCN